MALLTAVPIFVLHRALSQMAILPDGCTLQAQGCFKL